MSQIVFLSKREERKPTAKGSYTILTVNFRDGNGKVASRNIMSFVAKEVFAAFQAGKENEIFEVTEDTNAKGYKEFTSAKSTGQFDQGGTGSTEPSSKSSGSPAPKSNYETAEERASRQILIVRQSSISSAVAFLESQGNKKATQSDVIQLAQGFEDYVFGRGSSGKVAQGAGVIRAQRDEIDDDIDNIVV